MKNAVLWKRILNEGILAGYGEANETLANKVITSPIVVDKRNGPATANPIWSQFRDLALPFPLFWAEGTYDISDPDMSYVNSSWGALIQSTPIPEGGWSVRIAVVQAHSSSPAWNIGDATVSLTPSGRLVLDDEALISNDRLSIAVVNRFGREATTSSLIMGVITALELLALLSCKNVALDPRENDPKEVSRAIKRHGGNADKYRYHVLVVRPPGAKSDAPSQEIGVMPRHVCRGHFSEYGPEFNKGLLFGKYAGRFYVPPHLKGDKKNGEVAKDYAIK